MIDKPTRIYPYFLYAVLGLALYLAYEVLDPFRHIIILSCMLVAIIYPLHRRVLARLNQRRTLAAAVTTLLIMVLIVGPVLFFGTALVTQGVSSVNALGAWVRDNNILDLVRHYDVDGWTTWLQEQVPVLDFQRMDLQSSFVDFTKRSGQYLLDSGTRLVGNALSLAFQFAVLIFVQFFFLRDGPAMLARFRELSPLSGEQEDRIIERLTEVSKSVVLGSFMVALAQGVVGGLGLWIVGIPAIFWGFMMGFASFIPMVGTMLVWGPASVYLFLTGQVKWGFFLLIWGGLVVSTIDTVMRPIVMQGRAQMSTFFVFLSIIGGINYFGPLGILYGPLVLGFAMVMLALYRDDILRETACPSAEAEASGVSLPSVCKPTAEAASDTDTTSFSA